MLDRIASFTFKVVVQCLIEACKLNIFPALAKKKHVLILASNRDKYKIFFIHIGIAREKMPKSFIALTGPFL